MRSCGETCRKIIALAPEGAFKTELQAFVDSIFLELPEDPFDKYWRKAAEIMNRHIPQLGREEWVAKATHVWFNEEK